MRVGIIGTGFGAKVHVPIFQSHPGFQVKAIASVHRKNIEEVKAMTNLDHVYNDWHEMLEQEELDLVSVVSSPDLHHSMVMAALQKGCHVLCEKPMAFDADETKEMILAQTRAGRQGYLNYEWRFLPARQKVKEILSTGEMGDILHVRYNGSFAGYNRLTTQPLGWLGKTQHGGGMLGAIGSHMFDSLLWWIGSPVTSLFGQLLHHTPSFTDENGVTEHRTADDGFIASGLFANGASFSMEFVYAKHHEGGWHFEVNGTKGTLIMKDDREVFFGKNGKPLRPIDLEPEQKAPADATEVVARYYSSFYPHIDAIYESITSGQSHPYLATFLDGHESQRLLDAVRLSAKEQKVIHLSR